MNLTNKESLLTQYAIMRTLESNENFLQNTLLTNENTRISLIIMYHNEIKELQQLLNKLQEGNN